MALPAAASSPAISLSPSHGPPTQKVAVRSGWPQIGFDAAHTSNNRFENVLSTSTVAGLHRVWKVRYVGEVDTSPAIWGGLVFVGSLYALTASTGELQWQSSYGEGSPAVARGTVYIGGGALYALDARTGLLRWSYETGTSVSDPNVANGVVYVGSGASTYALTASTGTLLWSSPHGGGSPTVADGVVYVVSGRHVQALDGSTGALLWSSSMTRRFVGASPAVSGGMVYVGAHKAWTDEHGTVFAFDASSGSLVWSRTVRGGIEAPPAVANGLVYVGADGVGVFAMDALSGEMVWSHELRWGDFEGGPVVANGVVYAGVDHRLYAMDAATRTMLWWDNRGGWVYSPPAVANGFLYSGFELGLDVYSL
jgi:outer membrane protein assembly factor BamB